MALATATITYSLTDLTGATFRADRSRVWVSTNVPGDALVDTDADLIRLGCGNGTIAPDGTGAVTVWVPGVDANPASWQTTIHVQYPDRHGSASRSFGPFTITTSANLADLVAEMEVQPEYALTVLNRIDGVEDHGSVSGAVSIDSDISTHWLDATGATVLTLTDGPAGEATRYVSVLVISGADDVTVTDLPDVTLADGLFATFAWVRGAWMLAGSGGESGPPDATPPTDLSGLGAAGGAGELTITADTETDTESTVHYAYRAWLTSGGASGTYQTTNSWPVTITGLPAGAYTVQAYAYSNGGASAVASDTATVTAVPGWATIATDTYTAADGTSLNGRTTDTGSRTYVAAGTAPIINSNKIDPTLDDTGIDMTLPAYTGGLAVEFDAVLVQQGDTSNPGIWVLFDSSPQVEINRTGTSAAAAQMKGFNVSSAYVTLAGPTSSFATTAHYRIQRLGKVVKVFVDTVEVLSLDLNGGYSGYQTTSGATLRILWKKFNASTMDNLTIQGYS